MQIINPATEEIILELQETSKAELRSILDSLGEGQKSWSQKPVEERLECIIRFGELIKENVNALAESSLWRQASHYSNP
jgi:acyl-CoA reductase-like NAD-dependent aldehyde dehydrogenase